MPEPLRSCCVCRTKTQKSNLIHIVKSPNGFAAIDFNNKLTGRGTYICFDKTCVEIAKKSGSISKSLKNAQIPNDFWENLNNILESKNINQDFIKSKIISLLGLSRRSNNLIIGTDNIKSADKKLVVFFASDASDSVRNFAENYDEHFQLNLNINELSNSIGISSNVQIIAEHKNSGFAKKIKSLLQKLS